MDLHTDDVTADPLDFTSSSTNDSEGSRVPFPTDDGIESGFNASGVNLTTGLQLTLSSSFTGERLLLSDTLLRFGGFLLSTKDSGSDWAEAAEEGLACDVRSCLRVFLAALRRSVATRFLLSRASVDV